MSSKPGAPWAMHAGLRLRGRRREVRRRRHVPGDVASRPRRNTRNETSDRAAPGKLRSVAGASSAGEASSETGNGRPCHPRQGSPARASESFPYRVRRTDPTASSTPAALRRQDARHRILGPPTEPRTSPHVIFGRQNARPEGPRASLHRADGNPPGQRRARRSPGAASRRSVAALPSGQFKKPARPRRTQLGRPRVRRCPGIQAAPGASRRGSTASPLADTGASLGSGPLRTTYGHGPSDSLAQYDRRLDSGQHELRRQLSTATCWIRRSRRWTPRYAPRSSCRSDSSPNRRSGAGRFAMPNSAT